MMPFLSGTAFKMIQPQLSFHFLVGLFNTETPFRFSDQPSLRSAVGGGKMADRTLGHDAVILHLSQIAGARFEETVATVD